MTDNKWVSTTKSGYLRTHVAGTCINMETLFLSLKMLQSIVLMILCLKYLTLMLNLLTFLLVCETATTNSKVIAFFLIKLLHFKRILIYQDKVQTSDWSAQGIFVSFSYSITYWEFLKQLYSALKRQSLPSISTSLNSTCTINSKVSPFCIMYLCMNSTGQCNCEILLICCIQTTHIMSLWEELLAISRNAESPKFFCSLASVTSKTI